MVMMMMMMMIIIIIIMALCIAMTCPQLCYDKTLYSAACTVCIAKCKIMQSDLIISGSLSVCDYCEKL
eukprot:396638-Karenia_brevis.AAC.1